MSELRPLEVIILAAGQGTRMRSSLPKVLHPVGGRPMLQHAIDTAAALGAVRTHVVYGHGGERVREALGHNAVDWVLQAEQLGTGHAVDQAMPGVDDASVVLVLYGDVPLVQVETLERLLAVADRYTLALLTATLEDPSGYGRILRDDSGRILRIVEQKDASPEEHAIVEINTGMLVAPGRMLRSWLRRLDNRNSQGEYYLTDIIGMAVADGAPVGSAHPSTVEETLGANDRVQLAQLERIHQWRQAEALMRSGVTLADPVRIDIRGTLKAGVDCFIDVGVVFEGEVVLGSGVQIGANCVLSDVTLGDGCLVKPMSVLEQATLGNGCIIGPFARVRPESELADGVHLGNFVEIKKSRIGRGSKVNHLSYIGDTEMGGGVNIGAGTITCNYDGANKHRTVIGDNAFIGSDTQLVAPVEVGAGATIGAGSTITRNAPPEQLTLSRSKQTTFPGWSRPSKNKG